MAIHAITLTSGFFAAIFSVIFNSLLVFLVVKYTATQMKGYSRLLLMHCISDVLCELAQASIGSVRYLSLFIINLLFLAFHSYKKP
jgi:uncharacterized protein YqhQ